MSRVNRLEGERDEKGIVIGVAEREEDLCGKGGVSLR